ncbi:hypothetical protein CBL_05414 [Carabus blaptoides fortunei]
MTHDAKNSCNQEIDLYIQPDRKTPKSYVAANVVGSTVQRNLRGVDERSMCISLSSPPPRTWSTQHVINSEHIPYVSLLFGAMSTYTQDLAALFKDLLYAGSNEGNVTVLAGCVADIIMRWCSNRRVRCTRIFLMKVPSPPRRTQEKRT